MGAYSAIWSDRQLDRTRVVFCFLKLELLGKFSIDSHIFNVFKKYESRFLSTPNMDADPRGKGRNKGVLISWRTASLIQRQQLFKKFFLN